MRDLLVYGTVCATALAGGMYKGICADQGIEIGSGLEALITYGTPIASIMVGGINGSITAKETPGDNNPIELLQIPWDAGKGGLLAVFFGAVGYGIGYLGSVAL